MDFLSQAAVAFRHHCKGQKVMRNLMSSGFRPLRPYRITRGSRQMRERRTAQAFIVFGVVLACVELYVIFGWL
jgi:hypothetical protein